ncbi:MAG: hypothetical protein IT282_04120 [Bacteroidetes bacterium]|nr:hypothetical protein [Bacteroidota bacterium]
MQIRMLLSTIVCCVLVWGTASFAGQHDDSTHAAETKAQVPALGKFHATIYKLWHNAWPEKDTEMMKELVPAIEAGVEEIAKAELPGILRDKKAVWQEGVKNLQAVAAEYKQAMAGSEAQPKLDAAEKLHMQYERLVRTIRPVMKEIEAFHADLYMLYHYYLPKNEKEKIAQAAANLQVKMDSLDAAQLPARMKKKEEAFLTARAALSASVKELSAVMSSNDQKKIAQAIETMHSKYQALEKVFE